MFDKFKKITEAFGENKGKETAETKKKPQKNQRFGGLTHEQIKKREDAIVAGKSLRPATLSKEAASSLEAHEQSFVRPQNDNQPNTVETALDNYLEKDTTSMETTQTTQDIAVEDHKAFTFLTQEQSSRKMFVQANSSTIANRYPMDAEANIFSQTIATNHSHRQECSKELRSFLNKHKGEVNAKFWYMLLDSYQILNDQENFENTAIAFAQFFNTSPPSWIEGQKTDKKKMMTGKNILTLEPVFTMEHVARFKDFFKVAKQENFCRINVSHCRFEQSDLQAIKEFYKLLTQLRKARIKSFLMGESSLNNFCQSYINFDPNNKSLKRHFIDNEIFLWNIYLEVLQWKGKEEEFEELALQYADKFEISPQGWENEGVMSLSNSDFTGDEKPVLEGEITNNNVHLIEDALRYDFARADKAELDFTFVDRVDFGTCGSISHIVRELTSLEENAGKEIYLVRPNELILTLFNMLGTTEVFKLVERSR